MHRTTNAFSVLQATAVTLGLAILLWSVGLPSIRFSEAANLTSFSDTLSDSAPGVNADHTIEFTTPSGVANNQTIVVTFDAAFDATGVVDTDIEVATSSGSFTLAADCSGTEQLGASFSGDVLTITLCNGDGAVLAEDDTVTITIGIAANGGTGSNQVNNPGSAGSYVITVAAGTLDTGETQVAIVNTVQVTASVDTLFTFTVNGLPGGSSVNGATTTGSTSAIAIPFGTLEAGVASTAAQELVVVTNANNGFVVTVETDQQLTSSNGAEIDSFVEGSNTTTPTAWASPSNTPGSLNTYGHWGLTSDDTNITIPTGANQYVAVLTTPVEVFSNGGPTNGTGATGVARVGYRVEIGSLQEAATDYEATLTYIATPVF